MDLLLMEANRIGTKIIREMWNDLAKHEEKMAEIKKEAQRIEEEAQRIEEERIEIEEQNIRNENFRLGINSYLDEQEKLSNQISHDMFTKQNNKKYRTYTHLKKGINAKVKESVQKIYKIVKISVEEIQQTEDIQFSFKKKIFSNTLSSSSIRSDEVIKNG